MRLENLVEEVLELAGIQSNKRQYARERLLARELVEAAVASSGDGRIVTRLGKDDLAVTGDREALERALSNLLRNAVKHGAGGDVEVALDKRGGRVVFAVSDRGPGIPKTKGRTCSRRSFAGGGLGTVRSREAG